MATEFDIIQRYFAPLAGAEGLGLMDDAAHYMPTASKKIILTKDMLVEGIHFHANTAPADVGWKALAVNISDLIAKGASPKGYLLGLGLPDNPSHEWLAGFTDGLQQAQSAFSCPLFGGDTVRSPNQLTLSITAIGEADMTAPMRSGAKVGDGIYVTNTVGDAAFGFRSIEGTIAKNTHLESVFLRPQPPFDQRATIAEFASASADISDGLVADLGHILKASSQLGAQIMAADIPLSKAVLKLGQRHDLLPTCLTWGDDYQTIFTVRPDKEKALQVRINKPGASPITRIGQISAGSSVDIINPDASILTVTKQGYSHF